MTPRIRAATIMVALVASTQGVARAATCHPGDHVSAPHAFVTNVTAASHGSATSAMFFIEVDGTALIYAIPADQPIKDYQVDRSIFAAFVGIATTAYAGKLQVNVEYNCIQVSNAPRFVLHGLALTGEVRSYVPPPPSPR